MISINIKKLADTDRQAVEKLLTEADQEFVPPLSARQNTKQTQFQPSTSENSSKNEGVKEYFNSLMGQEFILASDGDEVIGFLSFIKDYDLSLLDAGINKVHYISTVIVDKEYRNQGITYKMYQELFRLFPKKDIATRTWSLNHAHIHLLEKLEFEMVSCMKDHRGPGIDTVYYVRNAR